MQQSLKEKENHIAQLLKERDFDRAEFTRGAQKFEETEGQLSVSTKQLNERNEELARAQALIAELRESKVEADRRGEADRSRIEDLEFQIEEHQLGLLDSEKEVAATVPVVPTAAFDDGEL